MKTLPFLFAAVALLAPGDGNAGPATTKAKPLAAVIGPTTAPASDFLKLLQSNYGACSSDGQGGKLDLYRNTHPRLDIIFDYTSDLGDSGTGAVAKAGDKDRTLGCIAFQGKPANRKLTNVRFAAGASCVNPSGGTVPSGQTGCKVCYATPEGGAFYEQFLCENGKTVTVSGCNLRKCPP